MTVLLNQLCTVTVLTADGTPDRAGVPAATEEEYTTTGYFEQRQATEQTAGQTSDEQRWLAIINPTATVEGTSGDQVDLTDLIASTWTVEPDGLGVFQVVGEPWPVRNPRTRTVQALEFEMRRVDG